MAARQELIDAIMKRARDVDGRKKLACAEAFGLAHKHGVKVGEIGRICNRQNIRICKCQLGCFP
jgi:hypothetical protein